MLSSIIIQGILIGVLVSIPMGPIGVLCIQRTVHQGRTSGFISGLGAATADSFFAAIAGFGLTFITNFFRDQQFYLMLGGAFVLIFLGLKIFFTNTIAQVRKYRFKRSNPFADFVSVFFLTLSNPITILFFGLVLTGIGILKDDVVQMRLLVLGIFLGAILWWFLLSSLVDLFRKYFRLKLIFWLNKVAGILIVVFGIFTLFNAFYPQITSGSMGNSKIVNITNKIK